MTDDWFQRLYEQAADDFCKAAQGDLYQLLHEFRYLSEPYNCEKAKPPYPSASDTATGDETS